MHVMRKNGCGGQFWTSATRFVVLFVMLCLIGPARGNANDSSDAAKKTPTKTIPPPDLLKKAVYQHFASLPEFRRGDLITRDQVAPLLDQFELLGWTTTDPRQIIGQILPERDFLAKQLRGSKKGIAFMRSISSMPQAFDKLDRLARLPGGEQTVHDLIHKKGGGGLIEYLTTTRGGQEMGRLLGHTPKGYGFNKPTGRIYTVELLLARLEQGSNQTVATQGRPSQ